MRTITIESQLKRIVAVLLVVFALFSQTSICAKANSETQEANESFEKDRYIVLLMDASGRHTFEISSYGGILILGGPRKYVTDSATDEVIAAASKFLDDARYAMSKNHVAVVAFAEEAVVISDFSDNLYELSESIRSLEPDAYESEDEDTDVNLAAGLDCALDLLSTIEDESAVKSILLCTTGFTDSGDYIYEGLYNEETVGSRWQNMETEIRLYAYANCAVNLAEQIKAKGITIYVVGLFSPIESSLPSEGRDVARFFRMTAADIASSDDTFFVVENPDNIDYVFDDLQDTLIGSAVKRIYNNSNGYALDAAQDDVGGALGLGGHFEEMLWGSALFEMPATRIRLQSIQPGDSANYNLAMLCGNLCITSYDADYLYQAYLDLGFLEEDIYFYSYPDSELNRADAKRGRSSFAEDGDLAFSIASRSMVIGSELSDLLVITLRGTMNPWEAVKDATTEANKPFYGCMAWNWIFQFEEDVFAGLADYYDDHPELGNRPLKILVTGHSLGGAGANLVAARLNYECGGEEWYGRSTTMDDIYAYTFGAIDSISQINTNAALFPKKGIEVPIMNGFENIINIYNYLDTYGPYGSGVYGFTAAGNTMYGKYGVFFTFISDMMGIVNEDSRWPTHEIAGYISAVKQGLLSPDYKTDFVRVCIRCPVDVEIFESDILICRITSDEIEKAPPDFAISIENGAKTLLLPKECDYRIVIFATDTGQMEYSIQELDIGDPQYMDYTAVSLESGKRMSSEILSENGIGDVALYVIDENDNVIAKVLNDGSEEIIPSSVPQEEVIPTSTPTVEPVVDVVTDPVESSTPDRQMRYSVVNVATILAILIIISIALISLRVSRKKAHSEAENIESAASTETQPSMNTKQIGASYKCPRCGADNDAEDLFCGRCGAKLDNRIEKDEIETEE